MFRYRVCHDGPHEYVCWLEAYPEANKPPRFFRRPVAAGVNARKRHSCCIRRLDAVIHPQQGPNGTVRTK